MAICPECLAEYAEGVETCPTHGCALVPDELALRFDAPLPAGTMVGEYRIEKKLGAGTFGDVYAGEQPVIGKRVAVKVLNRRFASDPVMVSRFVAEARAVNKIRQRNIIDIFSFGVLPGLDRHYFVMELLDGLTLGALLARTGRLPVALVLPVVRGIADALDAVHEAGITHRDLKPDNVFLARERDGSYFPKLLDFGIAKLIGEDVAHKTGSGMVLGTPRYMSPEQARGKPADHRADIYALGVMIHEMLTGQPLFVGDSAVDMLLKQAVDPPPRLSSVCPDLPPGLDDPVLAMLEKRPADRPPAAGKAVTALAARARELGIDRSTVTLAELAERDVRTKRVAMPLGAAVPAATAATLDPPATMGEDPSGPSPAAPPHVPSAPTVVALHQNPRPQAPAVSSHADPMSKTERAPVSTPEQGGTLVSRQSAQATGDPRDDEAGARVEAGPTTESVSTVETPSEDRRLGRARRVKVAAGAALLLALGLATWALGSTSRKSPVASAAQPSSAPSAPASEREAEPTVQPVTMGGDPPYPPAQPAPAAPATVTVHLATRPPDVEVWLGDRKLGTSEGPVSLPLGHDRVELRLRKAGFTDEPVGLTPDRDQTIDAALAPLAARHEPVTPPTAGKPSGNARKLDRILGGRE